MTKYLDVNPHINFYILFKILNFGKILIKTDITAKIEIPQIIEINVIVGVKNINPRL